MSHSNPKWWLLFCLSLLAGVAQQGNAQNLPQDFDSLKQVARGDGIPLERARTFNFLSQAYSTTSLDSSLLYSREALKLVHRFRLDTLRTDVYNTLAVISIKRGMVEEGMIYLDSVIVVAEAQNNNVAQMSASINLGSLYYQMGEYERALDYNYQALRIAEQIEDTLGMAGALMNVAGMQFIQKDYGSARESGLKALEFYHITKRPYRVAQALISLGSISVELNEPEHVKRYADEALSIATEIDDSEARADAYSLLGTYAISTETYDEALKYTLLSLELFEKVRNPLKITQVMLSRAEAMLQLQRHQEANELFASGLKHAGQLGARHLERDAYDGLMRASAKMGNFEDAWSHSQRYISLQDSLINEENLRQLNLLNKQFETEKQTAEIARLEAENQLSKAEIQQKEAEVWYRNMMDAALILLILLILVIGFFIRRQNQLRQKQKAAELEHRALRNQMNPHFIFNCLNSLQRLYVEGKHAEANDYMGDFADLLRKILENSNKSTISLHEELATLRLYLELERVRSPNEITYDIYFDEHIDPRQLSVPPLILQPFVENAIWHGILPGKKPGHIRIRVLQSNRGYRFLVEDNGVGFSESQKISGESHGIRITAQRIGSRVSIERINEGGTRVSFTLKSAA